MEQWICGNGKWKRGEASRGKKGQRGRGKYRKKENIGKERENI